MAATDWEAIEREHRAGQLSVREIARIHGVTDGAIRKKAKAEGWQRDLSGQVRQAVRTELVRTEVRTDSRVDDKEAVTLAAARGVEVVRSHRKDLTDLRQIRDTMVGYLKTWLVGVEATRTLTDPATGETETVPGAWIGKIGMESASEVLKRLSEVTAKVIPLERQAFSLDDPATHADGDLTAEQRRKAAELFLEG